MKMLARLISISLFLAVAAMAGCEATQYVQRGDDALQADRPREALASYQRAAQVDGKLLTDPQFAAKLREASWRAALVDAEVAASTGQWEAAIYAYEQTLLHHPGHPAARQGLATAKVHGAQLRYEQALAHADENDLRLAREDLRQALTWQPDHANALAAYNSLDHKGNAQSQQRYAAALQLLEQRNWQRAADALTTLINIDVNHLPARAQRGEATMKMAQSRQAHEQASRLLAEKKLDDALTAARRAVDIWPTNNEAVDLLERAQAARDQAETFFTAAKEHVAQGNYDQGIASLTSALEIFPDHPAAQKYSGEIRRTAADGHVAQARRDLASGEIESAAQHFRAALRFVANHPPARDGLVDVAYAHGQGAEKEGLWGNALLWYMEATAQKPSGVYKQAEDRARAAIAKQVAFDLAVNVTDGRGNENADTKAMQSHLIAHAGSVKPAFVSVVKTPEAAANDVQLPRPLFKAMMTLRSIEIRQQVTSRDQKTHTYNAVRSVPNPNLPALERALLDAERDLALSRTRLIRFDCDLCSGHGHTRCKTCRGKKWSECSVCSGAGKIKIKGGGFQTCSACNGRPPQRCATCAGAGHLRCNRCGGRGFFNDYDHNRIRHSERQVAELRARLRSEPPLVQEQFVVTWPYEQEIYRKTGDLDATVQVEDVAAAKALDPFNVAPTYRKDDVVIINANPQVGLSADGLDLPNDDAVYRTLLTQAAKDATAGILAMATIARANAYIAQANEHARSGQVDQDIEARVAAIVLLEQTHPAEAKRLLDEIRNPK